jgi:tetratricopeptide (TPR) repeat protein
MIDSRIASLTLIAVAWMGLSLPHAARAEPYLPADDAVVVETLRDRPLDRTDLEFRQLRAALRRSPTTLPIALRVAQRAIEIARRDSDPRYLGYAEAALAPFGTGDAAPEAVRLLRAVLLQSNHHFDDSLALLDKILAADPGNAQAWLTRASILQVQARYALARDSCEHLGPLGAVPYQLACEAEIDSLSGHAAAAYVKLDGLIHDVAPNGAEIPSWLVIIRAEMAERMGNFDLAERDYLAAVKSNTDAYAKAAYADFLLDRGRPKEVITLLAADQRADQLLLRLALAYQAANRSELNEAIATLSARFAAAHLRGDTVHLREEARFTLHLVKAPAEALRLSRQDWSVQKEPADARGLLEAARAAGDQTAASAVRTTLAGIEDQRLTPLLQ